MTKLTTTAVNAKTRLPAEDCVPWTQVVLLLVGAFKGVFVVLLWPELLTESKSIERKEYYHWLP